MNNKRLPNTVFETVVENTPLISIDLVVRNPLGQILLGKRTNRPAQGFWFVPGGRILKDESFCLAFKRLTKNELGVEVDMSCAEFLGPYEHFYNDNFSEKNFSTHYVALGYQITLDLDISVLPNEQHVDYKWWEVDDLCHDEHVHANTKLYFLK